MTGRDLIIYIMQNGLEDKPVFEDGAFLGFMTVPQFAAKMRVGPAVVETWIQLGYLYDAIYIGDVTYIPANCFVPNVSISTQEERGQ